MDMRFDDVFFGVQEERRERSISIPGSLTVINPCTGEQLTATGTTSLTIEVSRNGRVEVSEEFRGRTGVGRDAYKVELEGEGRFPQTAASYHLTNVRGKWEGQGRNRDFTTRGQSEVFATPDGRTPTGDVTTFDSTKCDGKPMAGTGGSVSISDTVCSAGTPCNFTVARVGGTGTAMVTYQTANGTAFGFSSCPATPSPVQDFVAATGTVAVPANGTSQITITTCVNVLGESAETFSVLISSVTPGTIIVDGIGVGVIAASPPPPGPD
jgi:hypothetical protein